MINLFVYDEPHTIFYCSEAVLNMLPWFYRKSFATATSAERELYTRILEELEMKVLGATTVTAVSSKTQVHVSRFTTVSFGDFFLWFKIHFVSLLPNLPHFQLSSY